MTDSSQPLILVTNDDGIESPGLAAAVAALAPLGELLIIAPLHQQTSRGRSKPVRGGTDGRILRRTVTYQGQNWEGFAVDATPAMAVDHGILELAKRPVALAVSGINYGENVGTCVTVSGTVGAALEAADFGVPAIAISLALDKPDYYTHDTGIDFSAAHHFLRYFSERILKTNLPGDVDVLKIEIPADAGTGTDWVVSRLDRFAYYQGYFPEREDVFAGPTELRAITRTGEYDQEGTDAHALARGWVSVTPLSLDLTSRVDLTDLQRIISGNDSSR
ncbi:MAG: 5'/3'-nucleotidase SurE [Anaerolineales bacterium]|nr:5'/3'-nucleotidase SurE [Anaerolineales bacterium]